MGDLCAASLTITLFANSFDVIRGHQYLLPCCPAASSDDEMVRKKQLIGCTITHRLPGDSAIAINFPSEFAR
jgi:hypothetical protein